MQHQQHGKLKDPHNISPKVSNQVLVVMTSSVASNVNETISAPKMEGRSVTKRLQSELMQLMMSGAPGISAFPQSDSNLFVWSGFIMGPEETYFEGYKFKISLEFPADYPYKAPIVKFVDPMYHPNVDMAGNICLDILKERWSAVYSVQTILISLQSLLGEPNNSSPLNAQAAQLWDQPEEYVQRLRQRCGNP